MRSASLFLSALPAPGPAALVDRIVAALHWLRIAHAEQRRLARARREFASLDAHALRDLGIERGEYESYLAESRAVVEATRVRIDRSVLAHRYGA
jgi:uncharacterized protein YjiS (DUF1127 family)